MIKTIKSERVNYLVSKIAGSKGLLELDPVIAGSSMLSVYLSVSLHNTDDKWEYFKRRVERSPKTSGVPSFGDVDCWFLKGNIVHDSSASSNALLAEDPGIAYDERYLNRAESTGAVRAQLVRSSRWANTFRFITNPFGVEEYQFIKAEPESPEDLIRTFDFINSMVAWKSGVLYYDERIDYAFKSLQLQMNDDRAYDGSIASRVFNALRAFKYAMRYSLDFDDVLCDHVYRVYSDIGSIDYDSYNNKVVELENLYGKSIQSVIILREMVATLKNRFNEFIAMDTFKPEYALFLVEEIEEIPGLKSYIQRNGKINQNKPESVCLYPYIDAIQNV
jgi:hypothetical protein